MTIAVNILVDTSQDTSQNKHSWGAYRVQVIETNEPVTGKLSGSRKPFNNNISYYSGTFATVRDAVLALSDYIEAPFSLVRNRFTEEFGFVRVGWAPRDDIDLVARQDDQGLWLARNAR